jgi:alpha-D-xyloside xylohydrolase
MFMAYRSCPTVAVPMLALLLLVLAGALPGQARRIETGSSVQVRQSGDALTIGDPALEITVRLGGTPLQVHVLGAGARVLIGGADGLDGFVFTLDRPTLVRRLPGHRLAGPGDSPVVVHLLRLLSWQALADGASLLVATDDPLGRTAQIAVHLPAPGSAELVAQLADSRAVVSAGMAVPSGTDEHFFGMGEQFGGVDQRGRRVGVLVQDGMTTIRPLGGYAPAPFFVSTRGYGLYLPGTRPSQFALDAPPETTTWRVTVQSASLDCYVLDGPLPAAVLARYADLTGHPPMPPPWTLGVWKTAIGGQAHVLAEAQRLRRRHMPVSVIWSYDAVDEAVKLGWPYPIFARIPPGSYPDLPGFTAALHREGFKVLGYLAPEFTRSRPDFAYQVQHGYFVHAVGGHIYLLDLTNPAALAWWQGNERQILTTLGFDGWFLDLGDRLPPSARFFNGLGARDMANRYPLLLAQAAEQVVRAVKPDALFVMRSGFSGAQSLQPAVWSGDQRANWSATQGLPAAISAGLSWGIAGAPFWGSDIGGYLDGGLPWTQQEELWMRWLEFGALSPIMRDQLGNMGYNAVYVWSNARTEAAFQFYAQLHQSLFPYLYSAARTAHLTGLPIMRHLFLAYPHDPCVYALNDEYLLGPDLLVAPVIAPGATSRQVYLPAGTWVDYWTGAVVAGGRSVSAAAPLARIPLFVRGGALLPTLADPGDTLAPAGDPTVQESGAALRLRLYAGGTGETVTLADGTRLTGGREARSYMLSIAGPTRAYIVELPLAATPIQVQVDGHDVPPTSGWRYDGQTRLLQVSVRMASGTIGVMGDLR